MMLGALRILPFAVHTISHMEGAGHALQQVHLRSEAKKRRVEPLVAVAATTVLTTEIHDTLGKYHGVFSRELCQ
ncbi:hypothetical protein EDE08_106400 [Bradyrhizobium sp. R2.2-H]|jgi:hypothetical protein|nr:hypothetical protein EDE10_1066 [Bradyrhizobium sp. Y-H1]TCU73340.1 hypothetical protein EDE08_106400 [Bradyrhizobium sp. R2.2-H]